MYSVGIICCAMPGLTGLVCTYNFVNSSSNNNNNKKKKKKKNIYGTDMYKKYTSHRQRL
jgi:hypothetical protein